MTRSPASAAGWCDLDGELMPLAAAAVPVLDRGFLFGDSVYEVLRTRRGQLFAWSEHLQRLAESARAIGMALDLDDRAVLRRVLGAVDRAAYPESYVRIVVTRGTGTAPSIDLAYAPGPPRWVVIVRPLAPADAHVRLALIGRLRNDRRALDPATKSGNYLNNVLGLDEARRAGATDCVFLNADGHVTEASTANVFAAVGDRIATPPLTAGILAGVTRALAIAFLQARGHRVDERDIAADELRAADELFLTSTLRDIAPVTHLDGRALHGGEPGPRCRELAAAFAAHLDRRAEVDGPAARRLAAG